MGDEAWSKHFDEGYAAFYWYNEVTGESKWENVEEINEHTQLLFDNITNTATSSSDVGAQSILDNQHGTTSILSDLICYKVFVFVNAAVVESPLVLLECMIRIITIAVVGFVHVGQLLTSAMVGSVPFYTFVYVREIVITCAALVSFAVPGLIWFVYRHFHTEDAWDLSPIPTVLGLVDARRFVTITSGGGASAGNAQSHLSSGGEASQDWCCCGPAQQCQPILVPNELMRDLKHFLSSSRS